MNCLLVMIKFQYCLGFTNFVRWHQISQSRVDINSHIKRQPNAVPKLSNFDSDSDSTEDYFSVKEVTREQNDRRQFIQHFGVVIAAATLITNFNENSLVMAETSDNIILSEENKRNASFETVPTTQGEPKLAWEPPFEKQTRKNENKGVDVRYFIAGGSCASFSHGIATPFDVVKTRIQAEPEVYNSGLKDATISLIGKEGLGVLSTGLVPTLVGFGLEGAVKFGVYESLKPLCISLLQTDTKTVPYLLASIGAGAIASTILCPMERARIKIVTEGKDKSSTGLFGGIGPLIEEEGLSSIFFGYSTMLLKQVPYTITKQCSFDLFATTISIQAASILSTLPSEEVRFLSTVTAAFLASILACTVSQPGDVILTRKFKENSSESAVDLAKNIFQNQGLGGFYTGYGARLAHVASIVTSQLVLYDFIKQLLGLPATVSG